MKKCTKCGEVKPLDDFYIHNKQTGVYRKDCKECTKKRNADHTMSPEYFREHHLKKTYGITLEQYDEMLEEQGNGCAICGTEEPGGRGRFHVDHCHDTGQVRGLLCMSCNTALGGFKDNTKTLLSAVNYLRFHNER